MIKSACECYYDAALRKQSTNCPVHDPYIKCELLEKHIDQLESEIAELRKDRARWQYTRKHISVLRDDWSVLHWRIDEPKPEEEFLHAPDCVVSGEFEKAIDTAIKAAESKGDPE